MKTDNKATLMILMGASCLMMFSLAACGVSPNGQTAAILEPMPMPSPPYAPERLPAIPIDEPITEQSDSQGIDPADTGIVHKGEPICAPAPYESHAGDEQYFYQWGDDCIVYKISLTEGMNVLWRDYDVAAYGNATQYVAVFFRYYKERDIEVADYFTKRVFENEEYAQRFAADHAEWELVAVGNAVYQFNRERLGVPGAGFAYDFAKRSHTISSAKPCASAGGASQWGKSPTEMYPPMEWGSEGRERIVWEINDIDEAEVIYVSKP